MQRDVQMRPACRDLVNNSAWQWRHDCVSCLRSWHVLSPNSGHWLMLREACCAGGMTVESRNPSHLAELIPHHNHSSLDGLNPVDILKPTNGRCAALLRAHDMLPPYSQLCAQALMCPYDRQ